LPVLSYSSENCTSNHLKNVQATGLIYVASANGVECVSVTTVSHFSTLQEGKLEN